MVDRDTPQPRPVDPDKQVLNDLYQDAMGMGASPERAAALGTVWEMAGELAVQEAVREQVARDIARGRQLAENRTGKRGGEVDVPEHVVTIDFDQIGWIDRDGTEDVVASVVETPEVTYDFIDLTGENTVTRKKYEALEAQSERGIKNMGERLMAATREAVIPRIHRDILQGKSNSVSVRGRKKNQVTRGNSLNTLYPAYKEDVQGTKNRVIVLKVDGKDSQRPAYAIAALYDHDDQDTVLRNMRV